MNNSPMHIIKENSYLISALVELKKKNLSSVDIMFKQHGYSNSDTYGQCEYAYACSKVASIRKEQCWQY